MLPTAVAHASVWSTDAVLKGPDRVAHYLSWATASA